MSLCGADILFMFSKKPRVIGAAALGLVFLFALSACVGEEVQAKLSDYEKVVNHEDLYVIPPKPADGDAEWVNSAVSYLYGTVWGETILEQETSNEDLYPLVPLSTDDYRYKTLPDGIVSLGKGETTDRVLIKLSEPNGSWRVMPNLPYGWPADVPAPTHSWILIEGFATNKEMVTHNFVSTAFGGNVKLMDELKAAYLTGGWKEQGDKVGTFSNGLEGREMNFVKDGKTVRIAGFIDVFRDTLTRATQDPYVSITVLYEDSGEH